MVRTVSNPFQPPNNRLEHFKLLELNENWAVFQLFQRDLHFSRRNQSVNASHILILPWNS